jgi:hypothetical protein
VAFMLMHALANEECRSAAVEVLSNLGPAVLKCIELYRAKDGFNRLPLFRIIRGNVLAARRQNSVGHDFRVNGPAANCGRPGNMRPNASRIMRRV